MSEADLFNEPSILSYLGLPRDYQPSPRTLPIDFLTRHIRQLPPHLLCHFSYITTAKERTVVSSIRNRRLKFTTCNPTQLSFASARRTWPTLWEGRERRGQEEGEEEKEWVTKAFLEGSTKHVGNLGTLLGNYEEEREAERVRDIRRERIIHNNNFVPEEDESDSDDETYPSNIAETDSVEDAKESFERLIRERFIYGLLEEIDYDAVDWDEQLDSDDDKEAEERWFDDSDDEMT